MSEDLATLAAEIAAAAERIRPHVRDTPLERSAALSAATGAEVYLKLENFQVTGSFKARGAMSKLLSLSPEERARGVIAASSGNHGAGVAHAAKALGVTATVAVPVQASPSKVAAIRALGAEVILEGDDCMVTETFARALAAERGLTYVSPYNDRQVMWGQGSIGVELARQAGELAVELDAVFVALGGGGLISGVGSYLKHHQPGVQIVACSPAQSPAMHECLQAGRIQEVPCHPTLSDATAGGVEAGAITFALCQQVIDRSLLVGEAEIKLALVDFLASHPMLIEGAAAVALAGLRQVAADFQGQRVAVILCGANIGLDRLRAVLA